MNASSTELADRGRLVTTLERLIDACRDAEKGYALAARDVNDPAMRTLLDARSVQRASFAVELEQALRDAGEVVGPPAPRGTLRGWVEVRAALPARSDRMILEECDRGETAARKTYESAMQDLPLAEMPAAVRVLVQRQYTALLQAQADVRKHMWAH